VHLVHLVHRLEIVVHTVRNLRTVTYRMHRSVHNAHGLKSRAPTALEISSDIEFAFFACTKMVEPAFLKPDTTHGTCWDSSHHHPVDLCD